MANPKTRDVIAAAKLLGFTVQGFDGAGHVRLAHSNGARLSVAATPSEYRGRMNVILQLERAAGRKLPRPNHRRSRKRNEQSGFSLAAARAENASWRSKHPEVDELYELRDDLIATAQRLAARRESLREIPPVLRHIQVVERRLRDLYQPVDPFDPYTLQEYHP